MNVIRTICALLILLFSSCGADYSDNPYHEFPDYLDIPAAQREFEDLYREGDGAIHGKSVSEDTEREQQGVAVEKWMKANDNKIKNWVGRIEALKPDGKNLFISIRTSWNMNTDSDGKPKDLAILYTNNTWLASTGNLSYPVVRDSRGKTVWESAANLKKDDLVYFSGKFIVNKDSGTPQTGNDQVCNAPDARLVVFSGIRSAE